MKKGLLHICVDFDGTMVEHEYPFIGKPVPRAIQVVQKLQERSHKIILYTMRSGATLDAAAQYMENSGIKLYGVNKNPSQDSWTQSTKVYGHIYIDDAALGCPLIFPQAGRPYVDWARVEEMLLDRGVLV